MPTTSRKSTSSSKRTTTKRKTSTSGKGGKKQHQQESALNQEILLILFFAVMVLLFCCNFGIIGPVGNAVSGVLFGFFGFSAYAAPILFFIAFAFGVVNYGNPHATKRLIAGAVLFVVFGVICDLIVHNASSMETYDIASIYNYSRETKNGGGVIAGSFSYLCSSYLGVVGTILISIVLAIISLILLTEKSFLKYVRQSGEHLREQSAENALRRQEQSARRYDEYEKSRNRREEARARREEARREREEELRQREEERRLKEEERENEKILRMDKKVSGVALDTTLTRQKSVKTLSRDDVHEITYESDTDSCDSYGTHQEMAPVVHPQTETAPSVDFNKVRIQSMHQVTLEEAVPEPEVPALDYSQTIRVHKDGLTDGMAERTAPGRVQSPVVAEQGDRTPAPVMDKKPQTPKKYMFPPLSRLQKGAPVNGDSTNELKETALRLQQTLHTFGVKVTITDISQGPSVTRYELQPEQGVKVSKIVGLADDIKLNLAATDIRIEAPIPGKAAIGIEVPNKENMPVALRDLLESKEFRDFQSNIAFAVGKDIGGKTVVADIGKMPHMLIAGSTGSGKSVCINTLIMSILYKAHPDDVKLIMVDPKVVELSVYNGIPHLLIPVVTDPKKASAALHWAVSEMEDRYRKFADYNVRDLKGYNQKVESMKENGGEDVPSKMPQIVIIVDELADLMMVAPGEVEESICRLAQLARAAGIHLIIATQRPSVDVITGLIKANMPSRVAFAVSSGVDSRTILDMNGAEKLLGKGDMLFYPQGYSKPARIQGAFVSDKEVMDVVDFLKNQAIGNTYAEDIEAKIQTFGSGSSGAGGNSSSGGSNLDEYFEQAARFIIDKDKASIGMLQRVLKIGFNRAARIMDQLCEYGVVGEEEGTKPRKVLMSMEQFEQLIDEVL